MRTIGSASGLSPASISTIEGGRIIFGPNIDFQAKTLGGLLSY